MKSYSDTIKSIELIESLECTQTGGDMDYDGTALEVESVEGKELFHVVVDEKGVQQVLFWAQSEPYRLNLEELAHLLVRAKEIVRRVDFS